MRHFKRTQLGCAELLGNPVQDAVPSEQDHRDKPGDDSGGWCAFDYANREPARHPMTDHYDAHETRDPAAREADLFARLPDILRRAMAAPAYAGAACWFQPR